ncbi:MAG: hypothetical protein HOY71_32840 [Nonomuraea sp.]|nr:hypothetical protein [Nonomuraea sp.]
MSLVDRECVRKLLDSEHADATLVFVRGDCVVLRAGEIDDAHKGLVIATRQDVVSGLGDGGAPSEQALDDLAVRLDNVVRDLGA